MTNSGKVTLFIALSLVLSGCAQTPQQTEPAAPEPQPAPAPTVEEASFEPSTLYTLLVAELASQRGLPRVTLHNYLQEARHTGDLGVIKRAADLANELRDEDALLEVALLWADAEPDNPMPYTLATKQLIHQGKVDQAIPMLEKALELDSADVINTLAARGKSMPPEEQQSYLQLLNRLLEKSPDNAYLLFAKASILANQGEYETALKLTQRSLSSEPDYDRAILQEADLQARLGHIDTALGHLREHLERKGNKPFRMLYTRLLMEKSQYNQAEEQADILAALNRNDENVLFYLGVLMLEHERLDASERYFSQLSDLTGINGALRYFHGRIAQLRGNTEQALEYYANVDDPRYLISSFTEITSMLGSPDDYSTLTALFAQARGRTPALSSVLFALEANWLTEQELFNEARQLLDLGIKEHPEDTRLLYSSAMLWERLNNLPSMEQDLRKLLELNPDNATALNALGYTLTDRTDRHQEALQLISKAHNLKPEDPAILDSMGWVYYHLGDLPKALGYLQQAYEIFPDPEIAAHLGTVYWDMGNRIQAMSIWDEALEQHPEHDLLLRSRQQAIEQP